MLFCQAPKEGLGHRQDVPGRAGLEPKGVHHACGKRDGGARPRGTCSPVQGDLSGAGEHDEDLEQSAMKVRTDLPIVALAAAADIFDMHQLDIRFPLCFAVEREDWNGSTLRAGHRKISCRGAR